MMRTLAALTVVICLLAVMANAHDPKDAVPTKYFIFREDCFESFFTRFDFTSDMTCLKFSFSKLVGYSIISLSTIYKLP